MIFLFVYLFYENLFIFKVPSIDVDEFMFTIVEELRSDLVKWFQINLQYIIDLIKILSYISYHM